MTQDKSIRGYLLPHPDNIASQDVARIRQTFLLIDADIEQQQVEYNKIRENLKHFKFETFINLWNTYERS